MTTLSLSELFKTKRVLSFELFPPKTDKGEAALYRHVEALLKFKPDFFTCTYGAGGSTQQKTLEILDHVKQNFDIPVTSHLTCVGSTVEQLREYLQQAKSQSVDSIMALRGDPPKGQDKFVAPEGGLAYANELVDLISKEFGNFGVMVAGYPEKHLEAPSMDVDLDNLKRKVDAGADAIVTQLFYDNDDFYRFRDLCEAKGISTPLVPGLLPVTSLSQIQRITNMCGAKLPTDFVTALESDKSESGQFKAGVAHAVAQTSDLIANNVAGLHYYVLNKSDATAKILEQVSL
ncbi:methylenetetrahydrofolate reductase [NAD(P)H] [Mariniblastus sp.]|nr:methylenetetrahydrofolate reductase [NAD(P)H] [Mariniblastus sp.]